MKIGVSSKTLSQVELTTLARWTMRPRLMAIPGVANVAIWGQRDRQLQVLVDPDRLRANGVTLQDVVSATRDATSVAAGGFIETPNQRLAVAHASSVKQRGGPGADGAAAARVDSTGRGGRPALGRGAPTWRRRGGRRRLSAADRRRRHQRRPGTAADRREAARRQHAAGDARRRERRWRRSSRASPASTSTPPSSGRRPSSRCRSPISIARC